MVEIFIKITQNVPGSGVGPHGKGSLSPSSHPGGTGPDGAAGERYRLCSFASLYLIKTQIDPVKQQLFPTSCDDGADLSAPRRLSTTEIFHFSAGSRRDFTSFSTAARYFLGIYKPKYFIVIRFGTAASGTRVCVFCVVKSLSACGAADSM